jgi:formylglycine-generating enzyme required for sulfatase activity
MYAAPPYPTGSPYLGGSDPHGPGRADSWYVAVLRGGPWSYYASAARCTDRHYDYPNLAMWTWAFRCVRGT